MISGSAPAFADESPEGSSYSWTYEGVRRPFVLLKDERSTWHGNQSDEKAARRARRAGEDMFWTRRNGQEYVVRDPDFIAEVDQVLQPQRELGAQQSELGARQSELGAIQSELGAQQSQLGHEQSRLARQLQQAAMRGESHNELQSTIREIGNMQQQLGAKQSKLGSQQAELGQMQAALGKRQREEARRAQQIIDKLVDEAIQTGIAERP